MKTKVRFLVSILAISALLLLPTISQAAILSPFTGHWQAIDVDGSNIGLTIGGPAEGPFRITLTDNYISFCDGEAGIVRGTGWLNEGNSYLLEADLHLECFTTGASLDFHRTFQYHPATNTLSSRDNNGPVTIYHRPGRPQAPPPSLNLRVNYGDDWVESFYEAGHTVWITVTEGDGATVRATAKLVTQPRDEWGGVEGFQTSLEDWGPSAPDIQPYDWVFGWVDNGASAQVQIGDISGMVDLAADSIEGAIYAPWFSDEVEVECHSWGAPYPEEILKYDMALPNGEDPYSCSWAGEWNILPGQVVGVGYSGPDGHWVANTFSAFIPQIIASESGDWFWTTGFNPGELNLFIYDSAGAELWYGIGEANEDGFVFVGYEDHGQNLVPGNLLVVTDTEMNQKELVLEPITVEVFDVDNEIMAGTAPPGYEVWAAAGPMEWQERIFVQADPVSGEWLADFTTIGFDITEEMRPWSYAHIYDGDCDANEGSTPPPPPNPHFTVFPEWEWFDGMDWPDGATVSISVAGKPECSLTSESWGGFFNGGFTEDCDVAVDDLVTFDDETTIREHIVRNLAITNVDKIENTVAGEADPGAVVHVWVHEFGYDMQFEVQDGTWLADFGSLGLDLQEGMCGRAEIRDQVGNATAVDWCIPNPHFTVFPEWEWFDGMDWLDGAAVYISVDGKSECSLTSESWGGFFNGGFPEGCDIAVGDLVTFDDGTTMRIHTVRNLAVTAVDEGANTIGGIAEPDVEVNAWVHGEDSTFQTVMPDESGNWMIGFSPFNLEPGMCGRAEIRDQVGNATAVDWCVL
jgi:hypothetical protein